MNAVIFFCDLLRLDQKHGKKLFSEAPLLSISSISDWKSFGRRYSLGITKGTGTTFGSGSSWTGNSWRQGQYLASLGSIYGFSWRQDAELVQRFGLAQCSHSVILVLYVIHVSVLKEMPFLCRENVSESLMVWGFFFSICCLCWVGVFYGEMMSFGERVLFELLERPKQASVAWTVKFRSLCQEYLHVILQCI